MRFNRNIRSKNKLPNKEAVMAFGLSPEFEFVAILLTTFLKDKFYESAQETASKIVGLMQKIKDKKFLAQTALYSRKEFGMRSVSHLVAGEIARTVKGQPWTKKFFREIVYRPDDCLEILSYYLRKYGKPLPNSLKKGLAEALSELDEYELAKYKKTDAEISLVDVVNLLHPKATPALTKLIKGDLKPAETWETNLTRAGQEAESEEQLAELKAEVWAKLVKSRKLGYFALLRNLRNILFQAPEVLDEALEMVVDKKLIKSSLVLPFRFQVAYKQFKEIKGASKILEAVDTAAEIALDNVPRFPGKTLVVLDVSGSMVGQPAEIGSLFAAILVKHNKADFMTFSDDAEYHSFNLKDSLLTISESMNFAAGGTNFHSIFQRAEKAYDRIIILSDMQGWIGGDTPEFTFAKYKKKFSCDPIVYSFDLNGYGTLQFPKKNIYCLAGFSDKTFEFMSILESDREAIVNKIRQIPL